MNGIKMSDCRFYVNEDERTIICVIPNTHNMVEDFILQHFEFNEIDFTAYGNLRKKIKMPYSFIGKAVCSTEDKWDEELGRMIAFSRAKDKCYKSFFKRANTYIQTVDRRLGDMIEILNDFGVKLSDKKDKLEAMIDDKTQKE